jgi:hypothetical protein
MDYLKKVCEAATGGRSVTARPLHIKFSKVKNSDAFTAQARIFFTNLKKEMDITIRGYEGDVRMY